MTGGEEVYVEDFEVTREKGKLQEQDIKLEGQQQENQKHLQKQEQEPFVDHTKILFELYGLGHTIKRYMDALAESQGVPHPKTGKGISGANLMIIAYLYENQDKDVFQKDLEEKLNVRGSTVSKVLRIMESKGLIQREQVTYDGRLKKIVLTQTSMEGIKNWMANTKKVESRMTKNFTPQELEQFDSLLRKAKKNFD